jgi:hypothetical protein
MVEVGNEYETYLHLMKGNTPSIISTFWILSSKNYIRDPKTGSHKNLDSLKSFGYNNKTFMAEQYIINTINTIDS